MANIVKFGTDDVLELRKPHPCGGRAFKVLRTGSEVHVACLTCGRDMTLERIKLEKAIRKVLSPAPPPTDG